MLLFEFKTSNLNVRKTPILDLPYIYIFIRQVAYSTLTVRKVNVNYEMVELANINVLFVN